MLQTRKHACAVLPREKGFSMIETLIVVLVISIIMGSVFKSINLTQKASSSQQVQMDLTQQAREFVDQLTRDLRSAGFPNSRNMYATATDPTYNGNCPDGTTNLLSSPCDPSNGVGIIKIDVGTLWFAGDVDGTSGAVAGTAQVKIIRYDYIAAGAGEPGCPCLRRTEYLRNVYQDPLADAQNTVATQQLEIQGIQNNVNGGDPIFTAYDPTTGAAVALPVDFDNNANTIANLNSIKVVLAVQSQFKDVTTRTYPVTRVVASIALNNCSEAIGGLALSC
jgi:prepilin-type N-terminal cleavage/methylation domain-containing protein